MRYYGDIYRPPSEAYSLILQVTIGCSHNKCTFCTMFKEKQFHVRNEAEVFEDLDWARARYQYVEKFFLADGDALCLSNRRLIAILDYIYKLFPECKRVTVYGRASDALHKSHEELVELREHGLTMVYLGAESGSDKILKQINKGENAEQLIAGVHAIENAGIKASVTFINGIAGIEDWEEHAIETGKMIAKMNASYVSLLTLMLDPRAEIMKDIHSGKIHLLTPEQVLGETYLMLKYAKPEKSCVFRSNHASNYVSLRGNIPEDNDRMMLQLKRAMEDTGLIKDERFRML
ncbi:MAG: radical SAM protein [Clostridia bacterium]|nr:radical SAM protein [Clostridia bacterium]